MKDARGGLQSLAEDVQPSKSLSSIPPRRSEPLLINAGHITRRQDGLRFSEARPIEAGSVAGGVVTARSSLACMSGHRRRRLGLDGDGATVACAQGWGTCI